MKPITLKDLKPYQTKAAGDLAAMIQEYPSATLNPRFDSDTGHLLPFLCRLRAITGAGKTPILALTAQQLENAVILWTTNLNAIISQTKSNLVSGGKYAELLPNGTNVFEIGSMGPEDWTEAMQAESGLTIMLATVASFNQDSDKLKIHQDRNGTTYWKMLSGAGEEGRKRPLYIFYDEGHGATANQFRRLRDLNPKAFLLASASPLPDDLYDLIGGRTPQERDASLMQRTIPVPTPEVVAAGLLKTRLYLIDCNIAQSDALAQANDRWNELAKKFAQLNGEVPIACFIVNGTARGVDVWEQLVSLGVPPGRIAVHLSKAEEVMMERRGMTNGLIDTYKAKKLPEDLKSEGYTHLIWNLTLREGWDEPMAYVAYIDDKGKSTNDMVQKIGRFVRQPNAKPFDDPDLNSAFFYFNISDQEFETLIRDMQSEMTVEGYEVIAVKNSSGPKSSRLVEPKAKKTIPKFGEHLGNDTKKVDKIILDAIPPLHPDALRAKGFMETRVFDVGQLGEDKTLRTRELHNDNASISIFDLIINRLTAIDKRITDEGRYTGTLRSEKKMQQRVQFGSEAMSYLITAVATIREQLNGEFRLTSQGRHGIYDVKPFNLISPNITGVTEAIRQKYRVRHYNNALHTEYNGLNPFEVQVAGALDALSLEWCRNPSQTGYGIPITEVGVEPNTFYPDFLLWTGNTIWAIDPKGSHIKEGAIQNKLFDVANVTGVEVPLRVALILEGDHALSSQGTWVSSKKASGFTLVRRTSGGVKCKYSQSLSDLFDSLIKE